MPVNKSAENPSELTVKREQSGVERNWARFNQAHRVTGGYQQVCSP